MKERSKKKKKKGKKKEKKEEKAHLPTLMGGRLRNRMNLFTPRLTKA
jgi:hypothetical protein